MLVDRHEGARLVRLYRPPVAAPLGLERSDLVRVRDRVRVRVRAIVRVRVTVRVRFRARVKARARVRVRVSGDQQRAPLWARDTPG